LPSLADFMGEHRDPVWHISTSEAPLRGTSAIERPRATD
jgi:hypothetical protein